ncbi:transposase [Bacteroidota bacterium]
MRTSKYRAEQVAFALRQAESGTSVPELCREIGISEQTFYRWEKVRRLGCGQVRRLRVLQNGD